MTFGLSTTSTLVIVSLQSASIAHMQGEVAAVRAQLAPTAGGVAQPSEVMLTPDEQQSRYAARTGKGST